MLRYILSDADVYLSWSLLRPRWVTLLWLLRSEACPLGSRKKLEAQP